MAVKHVPASDANGYVRSILCANSAPLNRCATKMLINSLHIFISNEHRVPYHIDPLLITRINFNPSADK